MGILDKINSPADVKHLSDKQLEILADELRTEIIKTVSSTGGHLASNLGVVELSIALHRIFNSPKDKIIWDVGHQSYVHKLLTGRKDRFSQLRQYGGLSGFTLRSESEHDPFGAGHSSTSISAAIGIASANAITGSKDYTIAVAGDGACTNGMIYEALNNCSKQHMRLIIILNDNDMSISTNVGALSEHLARFRTSERYFSMKHNTHKLFDSIPVVGSGLVKAAKGIKDFGKRLVWSENLFEHMGIEYLGPVNGNDIKKLEIALNEAKTSEKCCLVHVQTKKGKGYEFAEQNPSKYHSVGSFDIEKGFVTNGKDSFSAEFGKIIIKHAKRDKSICAITAAMTDGTGLDDFAEMFTERFFDVGIAEGHAVTFAGGLCVGGKKPVVAIYSTFLQRSYDQILHDVALQGLPVIFAIDRAGFVNSDGPTHHGVFDVAMFRNIPDVVVYSPENYADLDEAFTEAFKSIHPVAVRYPKGKCNTKYTDYIGTGSDLEFVDISDKVDVAIISYGIITKNAYDAAQILKQQGISARVIKLKRVKPIDIDKLQTLIATAKLVYVLEEGILSGGIGEYLKANLNTRTIVRAIDDKFITFGKLEQLHRECGFMPEQIAAEITKNYDKA